MKTLIYEALAAITGILIAILIAFEIITALNTSNNYDVGDVYVTPSIDTENPFNKELSINSIITIININGKYCQYTKSYKQCDQYRSININNGYNSGYNNSRSDSLVCRSIIDTLSCICDDMTKFIYDGVHSKPSYTKIPPEYVDKIKYNEPSFYDRIYTDENGFILK